MEYRRIDIGMGFWRLRETEGTEERGGEGGVWATWVRRLIYLRWCIRVRKILQVRGGDRKNVVASGCEEERLCLKQISDKVD